MKDEREIHFEGKIAQKVIVEKGEKILLVQDPRGGKNTWEFPGRRMNIEEDPREAVKRDFFEEMGVAIEVCDVVYMAQFMQGSEGARAFVIVYRAILSDINFKIAEEEASKVEWFTEEEIKNLQLYPEYKRDLEVYFSEK